MSIQLYVSNDLTQLVGQFSKDLRHRKVGVFAQQQIVTQTEGMNNWLKIQIAAQLGIAANIAFNKPNDIIAQIYYWLGGKNKPLLSVDFVKWSIYHLLKENDFTQKFPDIEKYYCSNDVKQIALAAKIADLFDQYQLYRPDTIDQWNASAIETITDDWQQWLWVRIQAIAGQALMDKTGMIHFIIDALQKEDKQRTLQTKLPQLQFFGIAVITPFYLKLFNELSKYIDVLFYLINPAPTCYWLEDKSEKQIARILQKNKQAPAAAAYSTVGNSLLNSWGSIVKDSFSLLFEDDNYINQYNDDLALEPDAPNSLLKKIQQDIYCNAPDSSRNKITTEDIKDGSLTINTCFTPVREVEVLYNYLVQLIDEQKENLSARDVVVMVSNIDKYAPFIKAIFDNAPYTFPYTIADESVTSGNNLFSAIDVLLQVRADSFKAEEILDLLESKYIRERFGISDTSAIRKRVDEACIRFGVSGAAENDTRMVSWQYGLQRILYGICISGEPMYTVGNDAFIPLDTAEGADAQTLIRFSHFVQVLQYTVEQRQQPRSIAHWVMYLQALIENMVFQQGDKEDEDFHRLITYLEKLALLETVSDSPISFEVFKLSFLDILQADTRSHAFAGAGITFCSLIPMRSIPFKVVAMLGIDFDQFPRKETKLSFNLLEKQRRKGDRSVKDNDKHLFLETILSAQKYFYLSYIGRSAKDGAKLPPSALVDELLSYIVSGMEKENRVKAEALITVHPLHGFSQQYFNGSGLRSYLSDDKYKNQHEIPFEEKTSLPLVFDEIKLIDLKRFFKEPIKWYFNKALGIYYREEDLLLANTEVFELDNLDTWRIKNDLLELPKTEQQAYFERQSKLGNLPLKNMGHIAFDNVVEAVQQNIDSLMEAAEGATAESVEINLAIDGSAITGKLNNVYGKKWIAFFNSTSVYKHLVAAYIDYLLNTAQGLALDFVFIDFKGQKTHRFSAGAISQAEALESLSEMVQNFKTGYVQPFLFCPSFKIDPFKLFQKDAAAFLGEIEKMNNNEEDYAFKDAYIQKAYHNNFFCEENFESMKDNTLNIFKPIQSLLPKLFKK